MPEDTANASLQAAITEARRQFFARGGWRQIAGFALLFVYALSLFMLVAAPYELWMVHAVRQWPAVAAHVKSVTLMPPPFPDGTTYWEFRLTRDDTGAELVTSDVRSGDFPLHVLGWSSTDADAGHYRPGEAVQVFIAPDGHKFFLEQGSPVLMSVILAACLALWAWVGARVLRRRRA